jgi:hypothetical protein
MSCYTNLSNFHHIYRASCIKYLQHALLAIHLHLLPVAVLNSWVILLHKDPLHKLHGEGGLAQPTRAQHHDLVLPHPGVNGACVVTLKLEKFSITDPVWSFTKIYRQNMVVIITNNAGCDNRRT